MTLSVHYLRESRDAGERLAARLSVPAHPIEVHPFPDQELRVTVAPAAATNIVFASLHQPNEKIISLLLACDALRRRGARRLVLVAPYLCYMRQDIDFHAGEAISQKVIGKLLAGVVDRVLTFNAHLHRTADIRAVFPGITCENLSAVRQIAALLRQTLDPHTVVVGPDEESLPLASALGDQLGLAHTVGHKVRRSDRNTTVMFDNPASVAGHPTLLIDDIVSSGGTLMACARELHAAGATYIDAVAVHALFPATLLPALSHSGIRSVKSTDSVPHPTNAIPLDATLADALTEEATGTVA
jgi:ribose-phosphate pyrophosphokinase